MGSEPAVARHFFIELALTPTSVAKSDHPALGASPLGDRTQHIDRARHREQLALVAVHMQRILPAPFHRMEHETAARFDRSAVMDGAVWRLAGLNFQLSKKSSKRDPSALVADTDPDRAILVVRAHCNHCPLKPRG